MSDKPSTNAESQNIRRLLADAPVVAGPCELDLLVFLYRHPRTLLTNEQLAAFVGYDMKQVARSIDAFIEAGLLERTQNSTHAARMYLLVLEGPRKDGIRALLELASTRQGRRDILELLDPRRANAPLDLSRAKRRLRVIA
jgi:DNA-binding MarR family transcriptional regulator